MADLFTLIGKIAIDCTEAESKIDSIIAKADTLNGKLGGTKTTGTVNTVNNTSGTSTTTSSSSTTKQDVAAGTVAGNFVSKLLDLAGGWIVKEGEQYLKSGYNYLERKSLYTAKLQTSMNISKEEAENYFRTLSLLSVDSPLNLDSIGNAASRFVNLGYSPDEIMDVLTVMGNVANGSNDSFKSLVKALSDSGNMGYLLGQEKNQFANAGLPIYQLLSEFYGLDGTKEENNALLAAMQADKEISFNDLWQAIVKSQQPGGRYYNAMDNVMDTPLGQREQIEELEEMHAGTLLEKTGIMSVIEWWRGIQSNKLKKDIDFMNDPTSTPEMQKVLDIVDAITSPTSTRLQDYLNEQNYRNNPDFIGPPTPEGWTPASSTQTTEAIGNAIKQAIGESMPAAIEAGFQNANITVDVSTGTIRLDTGAMVGVVAPQVSVALGAMAALHARGGA